MVNKDIQKAFSKIHAPKDMILEVLEMSVEKKTKRVGSNAVRVAVIAAVVIAMFTTTVVAATWVHNALVNGSAQTDGEIGVTPTGAENQPATPWYDIRVDVDMNKDAPTSIEKFYLPALDDGYRQYFGFVYKDRMIATYMWTNGENNWEDEIRFWQYAGGTYDPQKIYASVKAEPGKTPETNLVQLGGIQGYLVEDASSYGTRIFLWSDGENLFVLQVPDEYTDDELAKLLQSVVLVDDILPYCISMEETHIKDVFG